MDAKRQGNIYTQLFNKSIPFPVWKKQDGEFSPTTPCTSLTQNSTRTQSFRLHTYDSWIDKRCFTGSAILQNMIWLSVRVPITFSPLKSRMSASKTNNRIVFLYIGNPQLFLWTDAIKYTTCTGFKKILFACFIESDEMGCFSVWPHGFFIIINLHLTNQNQSKPRTIENDEDLPFPIYEMKWELLLVQCRIVQSPFPLCYMRSRRNTLPFVTISNTFLFKVIFTSYRNERGSRIHTFFCDAIHMNDN